MDFSQSIRDNLVYASGYLSGRSYIFPRSLGDAYAIVVSRLTSLIALPLPFLSFLALPFFGGTSVTLQIAFFYLSWSAVVLTNGELQVEIYGTLAVRLLFFLLPALGFLAFDCAFPSLSNGLKSHGSSGSPKRLSRNTLLLVVGVATANVFLGLVLQILVELLFTQVLHLRSVLKVTSAVPLPWTILKDVARGFVIRGILHYVIHRYLLHTADSVLKTRHAKWQHSVRLPFSLLAAYDHPVNYLLAVWLPTFVPAYLFRFHALTWDLFIALTSLEELFVCSGYAVLPSSIILVGMARRIDEHFSSVYDAEVVGNFGRWGVLDFVFGTTCRRGSDVVDDVEDEAEKHQVRQRAKGAFKGAKAGAQRKLRFNSDSDEKNSFEPDDAQSHEPSADSGADAEKSHESSPVQRKSGRRKGRKA